MCDFFRIHVMLRDKAPHVYGSAVPECSARLPECSARVPECVEPV